MKLKAFKNHIDLEQTSPAVLTVKFDNVRAGWEQYFLLTSDRHHDSVDSDNRLETQHLDWAMDHDALIFDLGDLFDVMQGPGDRRGRKDKLKDGLQTQSYFNAAPALAFNDYRSYIDHWALMGLGNHETAVMRFYNINLTQSLVEKIRDAGGVTQMGGYGGWVRFQFLIQKTVRTSVRMKYNHGNGVSPQMTFGTLHIRRQASYLPDADIVVNGHIHDEYIVPISRERLSDAGEVYQDLAWHLRTPSYKDEYKDGREGYVIERPGGPKPIGAIRGRFYFEGGHIKSEFTAMLR